MNNEAWEQSRQQWGTGSLGTGGGAGGTQFLDYSQGPRVFKVTSTGANPYSAVEQYFDGSAWADTTVDNGIQLTLSLYEIGGATDVATNTKVIAIPNPFGAGYIFSKIATGGSITTANTTSSPSGSTGSETTATLSANTDSGLRIQGNATSRQIDALAASISQQGVVTTGLQSFNGEKTFYSDQVGSIGYKIATPVRAYSTVTTNTFETRLFRSPQTSPSSTDFSIDWPASWSGFNYLSATELNQNDATVTLIRLYENSDGTGNKKSVILAGSLTNINANMNVCFAIHRGSTGFPPSASSYSEGPDGSSSLSGSTLTLPTWTGGLITGTTTVSLPGGGSGDALTSAPLSQFAATTSAELAGVISDETGSGALVFANSPALANTPTAPTASPGTNTTQLATTAFVRAEVAALIASAPGALDTLDELAAALGDDPNFATTITTALAGKQPLEATLTGLAATAPTADQLIYATGNDVFGTTALTSFARSILDDANAAAVRGTIGAGTGDGNALTANPLSQFAATTSAQLRGVLSDETGTDAAVFANSPALTGTPTAPTATAGTNTTQLATTAFVTAAVAASGVIGDSSIVQLGSNVNITSTGFQDVTGLSILLVAGAATRRYRVRYTISHLFIVADGPFCTAHAHLYNTTAGAIVASSVGIGAVSINASSNHGGGTISGEIEISIAATIDTTLKVQVDFRGPTTWPAGYSRTVYGDSVSGNSSISAIRLS